MNKVLKIRWNITNNCSLNCPHCYNIATRLKHRYELSKEELSIIISKLPSQYIKFIKLSGGEPFEYNNLPFLLEELCNKKICFGFVTNGIYKTNVLTKYRKYFKFITFSLDGNNQSLACILRPNINFSYVIENIVETKNNFPRIKIGINLILNKLNYKYIFNILNYFFEEIGIDKLSISNLNVTQKKFEKLRCGKLEWNIAFAQVINFIDFYKNKYGRYPSIEFSISCPIKLNNIEKIPKQYIGYVCNAGKTTAFIDNYGNLFPCDAISQTNYYDDLVNSNAYSLLNNSFESIWLNKLFNDVYEFDVRRRYSAFFAKKECLKCEFLKICSRCFYVKD